MRSQFLSCVLICRGMGATAAFLSVPALCAVTTKSTENLIKLQPTLPLFKYLTGVFCLPACIAIQNFLISLLAMQQYTEYAPMRLLQPTGRCVSRYFQSSQPSRVDYTVLASFPLFLLAVLFPIFSCPHSSSLPSLLRLHCLDACAPSP